MRYFEWLFPIHRYVRLRRDVNAWSIVLEAGLIVTLITACLTGASFYSYVQDHMAPIDGTSGYYARFPGSPPTVRSLVRPYLQQHQAYVAGVAGGTAALLMLAALPTLVVSAIFVRHRPGRRRPKCTWQTLKFVLLGARTWTFWALAVTAGGQLLPRYEKSITRLPSGEYLAALFPTAALASLPLISGATAVLAAHAVISLQDDRRCFNCGYFLINLPHACCPECGRPFDPAKLGPAAIDQEGEDVRQ